MGIKFGEIDSAQIIENEYRIGVLEHILEYLANNNSSLVKPSESDIRSMREKVVEKLAKKYPGSGIKLN